MKKKVIERQPNATGTASMQIEGQPDIRVDAMGVEFHKDEVQVWFGEGRGGTSEPKQLFRMTLPNKNWHYNFDELKADFFQYSDIYYFEYHPRAGGADIVVDKAAKTIKGVFNMKMKEAGGPHLPPPHPQPRPKIMVHGFFDLKSEG
ncbi:hypothetical protein PseAD21_06880 [Pseudomonas sp. AD21]|uniref:hypothetical protein n=1 Tax=Pseudomonas sp. AD21 TaxID=396378 RepID=UPI000C8284B5|nr:hypothetical protein [Pseudomonas sp. AD21]PMQ12668.1 hypothetical protein PseAD21_06880 [Pseudomonas sp. AD21]